MSYKIVPKPLEAFGYNLVITTPVGDQTIGIPIEQAMNDIANMAMNALWPIAEQKLYAEIPSIMQAAVTAAKPYITEEVNKVSRLVDVKTGAITGQADVIMTKATNRGALLVGILAATAIGTTAFILISRKKHAKAAV